jgi:hypothetical protein
MNTADKKVSLEIPLNTQMKIFAFLFKENYSMSELFSGVREVGYYGESQTFSIGTQTNNLSLGITLQSTGTDTNTGGGSTDDSTPPVIAEVTPITTPTTNTTPYYTFSSSEAGTITYGGSCATAGSATTNAIVGHNLIIFNTLSSGTYSDCTITVTDSAGNASNTLSLTSFVVIPSYYVAVGQSGKIITSSDGTSWDNRSSGTTSNLVGVTYGNSKFLTLTNKMDDGTAVVTTVLTSTNGTSWTSTSATCSSCGTDNVSINDVTYKE